MTSLTIQLPDELIAEVKQAGLLETTNLSIILSNALAERRKQIINTQQQLDHRKAAVTTMLGFMNKSSISDDMLKSWIEDGRV